MEVGTRWPRPMSVHTIRLLELCSVPDVPYHVFAVLLMHRIPTSCLPCIGYRSLETRCFLAPCWSTMLGHKIALVEGPAQASHWSLHVLVPHRQCKKGKTWHQIRCQVVERNDNPKQVWSIAIPQHAEKSMEPYSHSNQPWFLIPLSPKNEDRMKCWGGNTSITYSILRFKSRYHCVPYIWSGELPALSVLKWNQVVMSGNPVFFYIHHLLIIAQFCSRMYDDYIWPT